MFDFLRRRHMPDRALILYRAGLLDQERADLLESHLMICPTCQLQLRDLPQPASAQSSFQPEEIAA